MQWITCIAGPGQRDAGLLTPAEVDALLPNLCLCNRGSIFDFPEFDLYLS